MRKMVLETAIAMVDYGLASAHRTGNYLARSGPPPYRNNKSPFYMGAHIGLGHL